MKKLIFPLATLVFLFLSCSTNKPLANLPYNLDDSSGNYFNDPSFLNTEAAEAMIKAFPYHKRRGLRKLQLTNAWASFNPGLLMKISNDPNVERVRFYLAAIIQKSDSFHFPTVVLQVTLKSPNVTGKGSIDESKLPLQAVVYYSPSPLCPPPLNNCKL